MASIKVKYRQSTVAEKDGTVYYQIIHDRKVRQLTTAYHVRPDEWNERSPMITAKENDRALYILSVRESIKCDTERLTKIVRRLEGSGLSFTSDDIVDEFKRHVKEYTLFNYMQQLIVRLKKNGKIGTAENYRSTLNNIRKFRHAEDIMIDCISSQMMEDYEAWQRNKGIVPNTSSFYFRILKAVYNRAVEDGITVNRQPFRRVYTGVDKTVKRAIPLEAIRKMRALDLSQSAKLDYARDMFLLSFYLRGMSFVDMAYLRKSDLRNGTLTYRRRKTSQQLNIKWTKEMQMILDKYAVNPTERLLPILTNDKVNLRNAYQNVGYNINRNLKKVADMIGVTIPLTLYVARHSWASAAKAKGIPLSVISEGMGHDSDATTQIYLASLETSVVDQANYLILSSL